MLPNATTGSRWRGRYANLGFAGQQAKTRLVARFFQFYLSKVLAIDGSTLQTLVNLLASALLITHLGQAIRAVAGYFVAGVGVTH